MRQSFISFLLHPQGVASVVFLLGFALYSCFFKHLSYNHNVGEREKERLMNSECAKIVLSQVEIQTREMRGLIKREWKNVVWLCSF